MNSWMGALLKVNGPLILTSVRRFFRWCRSDSKGELLQHGAKCVWPLACETPLCCACEFTLKKKLRDNVDLKDALNTWLLNVEQSMCNGECVSWDDLPWTNLPHKDEMKPFYLLTINRALGVKDGLTPPPPLPSPLWYCITKSVLILVRTWNDWELPPLAH